MKKLGFLAASMGTAVLLAVGAASIAHMVTHPGEVVEEANAAEIVPLVSPSARPENAPSRVRRTELARADGGGSPQKTLTAEVPSPRRTAAESAPTRSYGDDDDDDDGDDD